MIRACAQGQEHTPDEYVGASRLDETVEGRRTHFPLEEMGHPGAYRNLDQETPWAG